MIGAYDEYGNVVDLVEREKQIRTDTIDDCIKIIMEECNTCKQPVFRHCIICIISKLERLKVVSK